MFELKDSVKECLHEAVGKARSLISENSLVFPIFTDIHVSGSDCGEMDTLCAVLDYITREIPCDFVADLGDNTAMLGRQFKISNDDLKAVLTGILKKICESVNCPLINVNGNHDGIGTDFFKPDFWNDIVKNKFGNTDAVYDCDGSYYYVDFKKSNTRVVVLSLPCGSDLEAEYPTPLWMFGDKQLKWLKEKALDVTGNVIILCHVPFFDRYDGGNTQLLEVWNGKNTAKSHYANLCGWIEDVDKAVSVIKEAQKNPDINIAACFSGHTHEDSLRAPYSCGNMDKNPLPCTQVVTGSAFFPESLHKDFGISVDVVVFTPSEGKISLIRVGDGADRTVIL